MKMLLIVFCITLLFLAGIKKDYSAREAVGNNLMLERAAGAVGRADHPSNVYHPAANHVQHFPAPVPTSHPLVIHHQHQPQPQIVTHTNSANSVNSAFTPTSHPALHTNTSNNTFRGNGSHHAVVHNNQNVNANFHQHNNVNHKRRFPFFAAVFYSIIGANYYPYYYYPYGNSDNDYDNNANVADNYSDNYYADNTSTTTHTEQTASYDNDQTSNDTTANTSPSNQVWLMSSKGQVPANAVIYSTDNGITTYYCRADYKGQVYYGELIPNDGCYVQDQSVTLRFDQYEVLLTNNPS